MPKSIFQDMVKINQDRRRSTGEVKKNPEPRVVYEEEEVATVTPSIGVLSKSKNRLWLVAVVAVIFFLFALSFLFSRAEVLIDPKIENIPLDKSFSASLDGGGDGINFELVAVSGEESKTVQATGQEEVARSARGTVIIYNTFSSASQRLDIDTRLEGSNGKIYKTERALTVPGMKGAIPGSVEVSVYGAIAGPEYNSGPLDFKILGFKGGPKYSKFYGRSKGDLSGGYKGLSPIVSEETKTQAIAEIRATLEAKLLQKATDQIPSGFILFKDAVSYEVGDVVDGAEASSEGSLSLKLEGTLYGVLLKEESLSSKISEDMIEKYGGEAYVSNIKDLALTLVKNGTSLKDAKIIDFNLSGTAKVVWKLDVEKLRLDLLNKPKKDFNKILLEYPNISSAKLSLSPVWNRTIPSNAEDINIVVNYPE